VTLRQAKWLTAALVVVVLAAIATLVVWKLWGRPP
jgi:hypothetical protein